jgi:outer membrane protein assembly factor BamB
MLRRSFLSSSATLASACLVTSSMPSEMRAEDSLVWGAWRGTNRDGNVPQENWPESLDENSLRSIWSKDLGDSYSGPVLTAESVFTTETVDGRECVYCFDRAHGGQRWKYDWQGSMTVPMFAARNGSDACDRR